MSLLRDYPNLWGGWDGRVILMTNTMLPKDALVQFVFASGAAYICETSGAIGNVAGRANKEINIGDMITEEDMEWFVDTAKELFIGKTIEKDTATYISTGK
jgi:hypothetical protein